MSEAAPVQRLYDALSAMMYGWEDDSVRLEAFAALKAAADWFAKDRRMTPTPELMARATQAVLSVIGVDDRAGSSARQAVVSRDTLAMAADIARAVIDAIPEPAPARSAPAGSAPAGSAPAGSATGRDGED